MKVKILLFFITLASLSFSTSAQHVENKGHMSSEHIAHLESMKGGMAHKSITGAANDIDIHYHRTFWEIDPAQYYIKGSVFSSFTVTASSVSNIQFDMADALNVDSVVFHGTNLTYSHSQNILEINLPSVMNANDMDSITVYYGGVPGNNGFGSFVTADHSGTPVLWTLSEPYGSMDWWPCKHDLNDKIDSIDIYVETDTLYKTASNGLLDEIIPVGTNKHIYHWKHRYPIPAYLVAIAVTNYAEYVDKVPLGNDTLDILNYVYPEHLNFAQSLSVETIDYMQYFDSLFGNYPFDKEKYGHAEFGWGGGMEHQTMSFMGNFSKGLIAHELAHQWFGNKITCGSWQDLWLNEGFASYLTTLTIERFEPPNELRFDLSGKIGHITSQPDGSLFVDDTLNTSRLFSSRLTYDKGAMVVHMLRWVLGDEDFFEGVSNYINDPQLAFGYARTDQLKNHLESVSGKDLTEFFDDWLYGEGYPSYSAKFYNKNDHLYVILDQTQSHNSVSFYEMPVELRLLGNNGVDTNVVVDHTFSGQAFKLDVGFTVTNMMIDPNFWIVRKTIGVDNITGVSEHKEQPVRMYPNPSTGSLHFFIGNAGEKTVSVYDLTGKIVLSERHTESQFRMDLDPLNKGIYVVKVETNEGAHVERILLK